MLPKNLFIRLNKRKENNSLRSLPTEEFNIDFFSNDYLGYAKNTDLYENYQQLIKEYHIDSFGSTGSRLISGNHKLFLHLEQRAESIFNAASSLFFNSGYNANMGLLSAILQPKDVIFYDELCHASIRDGLQISTSKSYKFKHNDYKDLISKIENQQNRLNPQNIYIITESVFSMDGDCSDIQQLVDISRKSKAYLIIDEAHALGVSGQDYKGLSYEFSNEIFARIYTCGKSLGSHGGFVLGSKSLKKYLINFSRPFIYTTAASPHHVAQVIAALDYFENQDKEKQDLQHSIACFKKKVKELGLSHLVSSNDTAIQSIKISGNTHAKTLANKLQKEGFGVKAILSPTVPKGKERIRICLHSFNTQKDIENLFLCIKSDG
jgi:8-amino-7-oxononanoate synthase